MTLERIALALEAIERHLSAGASLAEAPPPEPEPSLPLEVHDALTRRVRPGSELFERESERARLRLAQGAEPAEVARGILQGGRWR